MNDLEREILIRAHEDVIQFAQVISVAHFDLGIPFGSEMIEAVTTFASSVIEGDLMIAGDLDLSDGTSLIRPWLGDAPIVVERILSEWEDLGRKPELAEVCWFDLTDHGEVVAEELYRDAVKSKLH
jgi:hypothetical protein